MKTIKYTMCTLVNRGTEQTPLWESVCTPVEMGWNPTNEEIASREAFQGEYTVEDDGNATPAIIFQEDRIGELEEALHMLLAGVTE